MGYFILKDITTEEYSGQELGVRIDGKPTNGSKLH
jgi:hypothetical protein